ncbi:hypothetical protein EGY07_13405 [Chryseobacterium indologenes]|uniref:hypothetical protein n=1 Tax=Chryseobacterium TaxID=59732 RepID=UPI0003E079BD|nr:MULTISPECIES: hypothetical protein [Chryseobacterium]ASE60452.1 hypothetical protein CEQ15_02465 [Chryseobacterium indologenes]ATN04636.1 hypothetical protein CRN76_04050 [Chryseobacterium indologenes]AYY86612.1 hypothetical protein EGX91_19710 [Chryseobacterium indologenes]AYZ36492.1 hypothetical protein EGY07_13405 [Chryseobacterium indologenes]MBF6645173.1 hypothetical protein [Chryseobacterium indologenes]
MKTKIYSLLLAFASFPVFSQVGINTSTPAATLDVNGTLIVRDTPQATALPGFQLLASNLGNDEVFIMDPQIVIAASNTNTSVFAAKKTTGISLLSLGLFPSGFRAVNFLAAERTIGSASLFSDTDNTYTIPSTGVYAIGFSFRYGTGLQASLLANNPGVGIVRTRAGVATIIDSRPFSGANLVLLSLTISDSSLSSVYSFQAGDKISFGLTGSTALDVGLLGSSTSSFYIYKISN